MLFEKGVVEWDEDLLLNSRGRLETLVRVGMGIGNIFATVVASIAPLLVPMMLAAAAPSLLLARRISRLEFGFLTRATPIYRARQYLRDVLSTRDNLQIGRIERVEAS